MAEPLIRVVDLSIGWGDTVLQEHANFEIDRGDVFVILGGSGSGKSTMLRYLIELETPLAGQVIYERGLAPPREGGPPRFGVTFQSGALLGSLTVGENVALPLSTWTGLPDEAIEAIVEAKLRLVGLHGTESKMPAELSGGMKKRAAIARAMALEPELIFLDEPSAGLDPITAAALDDLILSLNERMGITVVIITHELASIFNVGKRCIMLDRASRSIIARGDPRELRDHCDDPRVRAFFHRLPSEDAASAAGGGA
ncbi:MAG TPA: ATP-binding cassette domain-containing protein [Polyangiaceae bacterium]|nr:ATP-binding cassette domain-containing protein [Polyangiaceae bacterium]